MKRQFTATCFVIENGKVLLIFHKKLKKWLPPGGHIEPNELPPEAAKREVLEETGLEVSLLSREVITLSTPNSRSFERPYLCLLEEIPAFGQEEAHQHMDFIYVAEPSGGTLTFNEKETDSIRWFTKEEVLELQPDVEVFRDVQETVCHVMQEFSPVRI